VVPPRGDIGGVSFVRADIRNSVIAKVIAKENVDTIVHMSILATPGSLGSRTAMKELNVIGTMQLLAAAQKSETVEQVVVKSTTQVYGASNRDPAMFAETMEPRRVARSGYAKDVAEIEGYVRGFARRRPDVAVTTLRCANVIGPNVRSPITDHLRQPVIPTVLGYDPRMQFLHEHDLYAAFGRVIESRIPGTFNIAGDGILTMSQVARRMQRSTLPLPSIAFGTAGGFLRPSLAEVPPELRDYFIFGRGLDTSRMKNVLGFQPKFTTAEAVDDLASAIGPGKRRLPGVLGALEGSLEAINGLLEGSRG
jgi:UDP-glucose 4-epimerase